MKIHFIRLVLMLVATVSGFWVALPDPFPIVIDDVAAAIVTIISAIKFVQSYFQPAT